MSDDDEYNEALKSVSYHTTMEELLDDIKALMDPQVEKGRSSYFKMYFKMFYLCMDPKRKSPQEQETEKEIARLRAQLAQVKVITDEEARLCEQMRQLRANQGAALTQRLALRHSNMINLIDNVVELINNLTISYGAELKQKPDILYGHSELYSMYRSYGMLTLTNFLDMGYRCHKLKEPEWKSMTCIMLESWRDNVIFANLTSLTSAFKDRIDRIRDRYEYEHETDQLVQRYIEACREISNIDDGICYKTAIEIPFNHGTENYYDAIISCMFSSGAPTMDVVKRIRGISANETEIMKKYFMSVPNSSQICYMPVALTPYIKRLGYIMVKPHIGVIIDELHQSLSQERILDILNIYKVVTVIDNSDTLIGEAVKQNIIKSSHGYSELTGSDHVDKLCRSVDYCNLVALDCFERNHTIRFYIDEGLSIIINKCAPEHICKAIDNIIKSGSASASDLESNLAKIIRLVPYIKDADVFLKHYVTMCGKRLLYSFDEESEMIALKFINDLDTVRRINRMISDITMSQELTSKYKLTYKSPVDLNVHVLTAGYWPLKCAGESLVLPSVLAQAYQNFNEFYHMIHGKRKLSLIPSQSKGEIKMFASSATKAYTLLASTVQIAVLMCFNKRDNWTSEDLAAEIGMEHDRLQPHLEILVKTTVLKHKGVYCFNEQFQNKKVKVKIDMPIKKAVKEEQDAIAKSLEENRGFIIDATIVRIMKSRKVMTHNELTTEVITQIGKFTPDIKMIKRHISILIDKEYIKRSDTRSDEYIYVG